MTETSWESIAHEKRESLRKLIPKKWTIENIPSADEAANGVELLDRILPSDVVTITHMSAAELVAAMKSRSLTAVQVTNAFCHRAAVAHQVFNCCSEIFFDSAFKRASELDEYFEKSGQLLGPLHGVPISLKDQFNVEGVDTGIGFIGHLGRPCSKADESNIVCILRAAGAILYVKSTVPMAMMAADTYSNIYGYTYNAVNRKLSSGGSSGGEASLIASFGSTMGFGTDVAGSIRIPAAFQGIYGLRPSHGRFPYRKITNSNAGQPIIPSVVGPMARDLEDLELLSKTVIEAEPWLQDAKVVPLPWRTISLAPKLTFGIMRWNGLIKPHPPISRALSMTVRALESAGHEVIEWPMPKDPFKFIETAGAILAADNLTGLKLSCSMSGEPIIPQILALKAPVLKKGTKETTIYEHWKQEEAKYDLQQEFYECWNDTASKTWNGKPVDGLICPAWESTSFAPGKSMKSRTMYTIFQNLVDCTSLTFPVTSVDEKVDIPEYDYKPISELDQSVKDSYDPELFHGTPVCLQLCTRRLEEEKVIALAKILKTCLELSE